MRSVSPSPEPRKPAGRSDSPLISVQDVSFGYPGSSRPALSRVSLTLAAGEYLAIVGPNGSGKSTLLRLLAGLLVPDSGRILVAGIDSSDRSRARELRSRIALVFQSPFDQLVSTVAEEDVAFGPENLGLPRSEIALRVDSALAAVGLEAERKRPCVFLSAGQQQRLALAGALAMEPLCVAFDEATSMLDPAGRSDVLGLVDGLVARGTAAVHVTHDMDEAARASRVIVLEDGAVAFDGTPDSLFGGRSPASAGRGLGMPRCAKAAFALGLEARAREGAASLAARILEAVGGPARAREAVAAAAAAPARPEAAPRGAAAAAPDAAFALEGASHSYLRGTSDEAKGASDLTMAVPRGALVALVGRTGAGKSTALQLLNGLASADRGRALAFGQDLAGRGTDLRRVRMRSPLAIQRPESALFETFAGDDVAFGPRNQGLAGPALVGRARAAMAEVGLPFEEYRDRRVRALSGGERRKLALAGVLALEPDALLLDEPGSALDPPSREAVIGLIRGRADGSRTAVMATHDMEAAARADLVAVMSGGELAAFGTPAELFSGELPERWGISRPFAAEVARELRAAGLPLDPPPLDEAGLAERLGPALAAARKAGGSA